MTYHVITRGIRRASIFVDDDDRRRFLQLLASVVQRFALRCHAYCQMTNHYHIALTTTDANLSRAVRQLNGEYAQWWNWRHERVGHVFQSRFNAQIVQNDGHLLNVCRYIVLNPVRAGIVSSADEWPWSSYRATAGMDAPPGFLDADLLLEIVARGAPTEGSLRFRQAVLEAEAHSLELPRAAILGDDLFVAQLQAFRKCTDREVPRHQGRRALKAIFEGAVTRAARNDAVRVAIGERYALADIARYLEVHPGTVSKIVAGQVPGHEKTSDSRPDPSSGSANPAARRAGRRDSGSTTA